MQDDDQTRLRLLSREENRVCSCDERVCEVRDEPKKAQNGRFNERLFLCVMHLQKFHFAFIRLLRRFLSLSPRSLSLSSP